MAALDFGRCAMGLEKGKGAEPAARRTGRGATRTRLSLELKFMGGGDTDKYE